MGLNTELCQLQKKLGGGMSIAWFSGINLSKYDGNARFNKSKRFIAAIGYYVIGFCRSAIAILGADR